MMELNEQWLKEFKMFDKNEVKEIPTNIKGGSTMLDTIKTIAGNYTEERKQFACLIAYELGAMNETDSLRAMSKCLEYAQKHEFVLEKDSEEGIINTELARLAAADYARKIASELRNR